MISTLICACRRKSKKNISKKTHCLSKGKKMTGNALRSQEILIIMQTKFYRNQRNLKKEECQSVIIMILLDKSMKTKEKNTTSNEICFKEKLWPAHSSFTSKQRRILILISVLVFICLEEVVQIHLIHLPVALQNHSWSIYLKRKMNRSLSWL